MFRFSQLELPWALGPPDGRYLVRPEGSGSDASPSHVLVLATLGAPERHRLAGRRSGRRREAPPHPAPSPVSTTRATIVDVGVPLADETAGRAWLRSAGEAELEAGLAVLNRALRAHRTVTGDPYVRPAGRGQALVARVGFGAGEQVADGAWTEARELAAESPRPRRARVLAPQARLAARLTGRERALLCEELTLRARLDLEEGHERTAALQLMIALDAAVAELPGEGLASDGPARLAELRGEREPVARAAQAALAGPLAADDRARVASALERLEAALRARAARTP